MPPWDAVSWLETPQGTNCHAAFYTGRQDGCWYLQVLSFYSDLVYLPLFTCFILFHYTTKRSTCCTWILSIPKVAASPFKVLLVYLLSDCKLITSPQWSLWKCWCNPCPFPCSSCEKLRLLCCLPLQAVSLGQSIQYPAMGRGNERGT